MRVPQSIRKLKDILAPVVGRISDWCAANYMKMCRDVRQQRKVIALLVCCAALAFLITLSRLQSATRSLGSTTVVLIAVKDIHVGDTIAPSSFLPKSLPVFAVAPTALHGQPTAAIALQNIARGELLTSTNTGMSATLQLRLPSGFRSVAVVPPNALPPMKVGDRVDVIANSTVLAADALVLGLLDDPLGVIVAVTVEASPAVASAAAIGDATLVVSS